MLTNRGPLIFLFILKPYPLLCPGNAKSSSVQQKGSARSFKRMMFLESYCINLLKCDTTVTQNSVVTQFFMPRDHELQPDYTKNRYDCHVSIYVELSKTFGSFKHSFSLAQHRDPAV